MSLLTFQWGNIKEKENKYVFNSVSHMIINKTNMLRVGFA